MAVRLADPFWTATVARIVVPRRKVTDPVGTPWPAPLRATVVVKVTGVSRGTVLGVVGSEVVVGAFWTVRDCVGVLPGSKAALPG